MGKIKRLFQLWFLYAKMDLAWLLRDTTFAVLAVFTDAISNVSAVTGIFLLAWRFDGLGGMGRYEVLFMLAYGTLITGIYQCFFNFNVSHISRRIGRGQLEHMFIQPIPLPLQLATEGFIPFTGGGNLISGAIIMVLAVNGLEIALPWWWILSLAGNLLITLAILLAASFFASSLAFYAPVQAEEISSYVFGGLGHIGNFPLSGMPPPLQLSLISIIPAGLMAWFPTLALLGRPPFDLPAWYPLAFALFLWLIAAYFFRKGLKYYVEKGINRYVRWGHRS